VNAVTIPGVVAAGARRPWGTGPAGQLLGGQQERVAVGGESAMQFTGIRELDLVLVLVVGMPVVVLLVGVFFQLKGRIKGRKA